MKNTQLEILKKLAKGVLTINEADRQLLALYVVSNRPTGIKDRNGKEIHFGDTVRFVNKWEWYKREWFWKFLGKKGEERRKLKAEYEALPYEERTVEDENDYEWLLSSEIQVYWEVI